MRRPFSLSPRLAAVAGLVPQGTSLVDIGTDHGRLPVWLVQHGVVAQAIATDLRPKPLERARALAERWNVAEHISFRLCDGLSGIAPEEAKTVVLAGMGGDTMRDILASASGFIRPEQKYIFQPMSGQAKLRRYITTHGFAIRRELLVPEGETIYVVLLAEPGTDRPLSEGEIWVGRQTPDQTSPFRECFLTQRLQKLRLAAEGLAQSGRAEDRLRKAQYERAAQEVALLEQEWRQWQS